MTRLEFIDPDNIRISSDIGGISGINPIIHFFFFDPARRLNVVFECGENEKEKTMTTTTTTTTTATTTTTTRAPLGLKRDEAAGDRHGSDSR